MEEPIRPGVIVKNPWVARAKKFLIAVAITIVEVANAWAGGPEWLYPAAAAVGTLILYRVPNAPTYKDPR